MNANTQHESDMMDIGDDFRECGVMDAAFRLWFDKLETKDQYIQKSNEYKDLIVAMGWQNDVKKHYTEWKRSKGY